METIKSQIINENLTSEELLLLEATRSQLVSKSKSGANYSPLNQSHGRNRYERRKMIKIPNQVKTFNSINMNDFFKKDILSFNLEVIGENRPVKNKKGQSVNKSEKYIVKIRIDNVLKEIQNNIKSNNNKLEFRTIYQSVARAFDNNDVYVWCSCPDWKYRFNYLANQNKYNSAKPGSGLEWTKASLITNPNDDKGSGCKHVNAVIANRDWIMKVSSTINNYIHYAEENMEQQFLGIIFKALYGVSPERGYQLSLFPNDNRQYLKHSKGIINAINDYGKNRGKFKSGELNPKFNKDKVEKPKILPGQMRIKKSDLQPNKENEKEETK